MIILPDGLARANTFIASGSSREKSLSHSETLRILLLNLMPEKAMTEGDMVRMLADYPQDIEIIPMKISGQTYKTTPQEYIDCFYTDFEDLATDTFDGMIVTGAPIEHLDFEEVRYWQQLTDIMEWAKTHVRSTLYVCWGAQAGLYYHWGVPKYPLPQKMFGIFPYQHNADTPLLTHMANPMKMPTSRHTEIRLSDIPDHPRLHVVATSEEAGVGLVVANEGREVFITGHLEYARHRLDDEYKRDMSKGKPIHPPLHYYEDGAPLFSWKETAVQFYHNWVKEYVSKQA